MIRPLLAGLGTVAITSLAPGQAPFQSTHLLDGTIGDTEPDFLAHGDFDGDGRIDLVVNNDESRAISIKYNLGGQSFSPPTAVVQVGTGQFLGSPAASDINADGRPDIVYLSSEELYSVMAIVNLGAGQFGAPTKVFEIQPATDFVNRFEMQDLNGDGWDDIVVFTGITVLGLRALAQGDGTFGAVTPFTSPSGDSFGLVFGDVDGDQNVDLINGRAGSIEWARGFGDGLFTPRVEIDLNLQAGFSGPLPSLVDFDQDGLLDIVHLDRLPGTMAPRVDLMWIRSLGGGAFAPSQLILGDVLLSDIVRWEDFDLDGDPDAVIQTSFSSSLAYIENLGSGVLAAPTPITTELQLYQGFTFFDSDGDADQDFVVTTLTLVSPGVVLRGLELGINGQDQGIGTAFCVAAAPNSTGSAGHVNASGSTSAAANTLTLAAEDLPQNAFGYFLASQGQIGPAAVSGSEGFLCLGGRIGRFLGPGEIGFTGTSGTFDLEVDLTAVPDPFLGPVAVLPGDTWSFQAWHRDTSASGAPTSNFTDGVEISFQ